MAYPSDYGCAVCSEESAPHEDNPLVFCDGCNVCVHKACYGILSIPTGDWFCSKCAFHRAKSNGQAGETPKAATDSDAQKSLPAVSCQLCPSKEGALKQTRDGKWAHVVCALYIKEVSFQNTELMEPIILNEVPKHRFQQTCYICVEEGKQAESTTGACSICEKGACKKAFHVTCAQRKGLLCEIFKKNKPDQVIYAGFCADHIPPGEHGTVDGARYRKIPSYPRAPSSGGIPERASSSSGYSTPNKSSSPPAGQVSVENVQNSVQAANETEKNQRSSSIKSNASVGSNGTTESADSGILTSSDPERVPSLQNSTTATVANEPAGKNERAIRKPPKKSLAARMDGAGIPALQSPSSSSHGSPQVSSQPSSSVSAPVPSPQQQQQPTPPQMTVQSPSQLASSSSSLAPPSLPSHCAFPQYAMMPMSMAPLQQSPGDPPRYYHADNPFATPHDMAYQMNKPVGVVSMESMSQNRSPSMMQQAKNGVNQPTDRPTPPLRKRPLSPSILDSETLTISSLIERTIERATTSTTTVPPVSVPYTTGVRPMFPGEDNSKPTEGSASKKGKRQPKEPKNDPRRQGTTATIKDILANNGVMSPQQQAQLMQGSSQQPAPYSAPQPEPAHASQGKDAGKPRSQPPSFVGTPTMGDDKTNHSPDSPFNREQRPLTPRSLAARHESNDRHKNTMEKVQHYLNNSIAPSDVIPGSPLSISTAQQQTKGGKKNQEEKVSRASYGQGRSGGSQQAPDARSHQQMAPREEPAMAKKVNGYPNGPVSTENTAGQPEDDVETPAGAMAFDHYMYQLATLGTNAAHNAAVGLHPSAAVTLDGFFRMQKELTSLKQKVGELESLKAFYLTQVQSLRSLSEKYAADGPVTQPTMPEEVARLIGMLGPTDGLEEPSAPVRTKVEVPSDGLMARLHEPGAGSSRGRSDSRVGSNAPPSSSVPHHVQQSPSSTPKPPSRSARAVRDEKDKNERDGREYVNGSGGGYSGNGGSGGSSGNGSSGNVRRPHYEHLDGLPSGVVSTPAQVATTQAMLMPSMNGQPFLFQNPMYSMTMDPRIFGMMPGQMAQMQAFLPQTVYAQNMTGYTPVNTSDYAGLGRMHTPTSSRYTMEENGGSAGGSSLNQQQHQSNMKRDYDMPRES
ncbi:hypothetical protein RvY_10488 [Ramazzottius varieornatus]|uniref:PHD-type domain-containing protein n=1 Tax=Ramazzottius varieornatus TaxID=947166 RepID=A0A1D1VCX3_RAMVA|nr:hypothetical protein RvY_10488 [Ramazzottius varieornatus]